MSNIIYLLTIKNVNNGNIKYFSGEKERIKDKIFECLYQSNNDYTNSKINERLEKHFIDLLDKKYHEYQNVKIGFQLL